jgi:hypothetical protein
MADRVEHAGMVSVAFMAAVVGGLGMVNTIAAPEPEKTQQPQQQMATICDRLRIRIDDAEYKIRAFREAQSQVLETQLDPRFDDMAREWQTELAGMIADYGERCIAR